MLPLSDAAVSSGTFVSSPLSHCTSGVMTFVSFPGGLPPGSWLMIHFPLSFNLLNYLPAHNPAFHHHHLHSVSFIHLRLPRPLTSNLSWFFCFIAAPFFLSVSLIATPRRFPSIFALISHLLQPFTHPSVTGCVAPSAVFVLPASVGHLHDFFAPSFLWTTGCHEQCVSRETLCKVSGLKAGSCSGKLLRSTLFTLKTVSEVISTL